MSFMADKRPAIAVRNLVGGYGDTVILDRVSFEIHHGERFVILGASGCGKSTLLKILIGLLPPISGSILLDGEDITQLDEATFRHALQKIGVLFQSSALLGSMTLAENIALPLETYTDLPPEQIELLVQMKLALVNLSGFENHLPSEISGGMKKRAGLARALALNPKILFFDEPSAGLDPISSAELDELILHINHTLGTTMVIVTHELESIYAVAQRVIMLDGTVKGIVAAGDPGYLRDHHHNPYVQQFFRRQTATAAAKVRSAADGK